MWHKFIGLSLFLASVWGSSVTIAIKDTSMSCAENPVNAWGTGAQMMHGKHVAYLCQHICPFPTRKARNCFSFFINSYVVNWTMSIHYTAYTQYIPCDCLQAPRKLWQRGNWGPKKMGLLWFGAVWRGVVMLMLMGQMPDKCSHEQGNYNHGITASTTTATTTSATTDVVPTLRVQWKFTNRARLSGQVHTPQRTQFVH